MISRSRLIFLIVSVGLINIWLKYDPLKNLVEADIKMPKKIYLLCMPNDVYSIMNL